MAVSRALLTFAGRTNPLTTKGGVAPSLASRRRHGLAEADRAGCILRLAWLGNLGFPDARLENALAARVSIAAEIRRMRPRVVILPYWEARHADHYRALEMG